MDSAFDTVLGRRCGGHGLCRPGRNERKKRVTDRPLRGQDEPRSSPADGWKLVERPETSAVWRRTCSLHGEERRLSVAPLWRDASRSIRSARESKEAAPRDVGLRTAIGRHPGGGAVVKMTDFSTKRWATRVCSGEVFRALPNRVGRNVGFVGVGPGFIARGMAATGDTVRYRNGGADALDEALAQRFR